MIATTARTQMGKVSGASNFSLFNFTLIAG
jgi:hypothetical protein